MSPIRGWFAAHWKLLIIPVAAVAVGLAIALPAASVRLVESNGRKCAFIQRAIGACEIQNAQAVHARAEVWREGTRTFDLVTARAGGP